MSVSKKKLTVIDTTGRPTVNTATLATQTPAQAPVPTPASDNFQYWGNQAATARDQGWYAAVPMSGQTIYRQKYNAPFNTIDLGGGSVGHLEVIGKRGNKMDIVIADKAGQPVHTIHSNVSPDFVQDYITNKASTGQQVVDRYKREQGAINLKR